MKLFKTASILISLRIITHQINHLSSLLEDYHSYKSNTVTLCNLAKVFFLKNLNETEAVNLLVFACTLRAYRATDATGLAACRTKNIQAPAKIKYYGK